MMQRLNKMRNFLKEKQIDCMIVNKPENRFYFSGFSGSAGTLLITQSAAKLITDFRYVEQAAEQAPDFDILRQGTSGTTQQILYQCIEHAGLSSIAFESDYVTYDEYRRLQSSLHEKQIFPLHIDHLRMTKDEIELSNIKKAAEIADKAFVHILSYIRPGISENAVAVELEYKMRQLGAEKSAFDIIVASGKRGALPHGRASDKLIENGDLVTMDFGAVYHGYHSDITRTVAVGKANSEQRNIYHIVLDAYLAGLQAVRPGKTGKEIDEAARKIIIDCGYGEYFGHGLGHGVGLEIHEEPKVSPSNTSVKMIENMIITIEPGIYIPDWGGIRIEDTVVVCPEGSKPLTVSSKQLIELPI